MGSGMASNPSIVSRVLGSVVGKLGSGDRPDQATNKVKRLGISPRQQRLNRLWAWYNCEAYATRKLDWNAQEEADPIATENIATSGIIPPGFYDASKQNVPLKFRKPTAPYPLVKVIVDRFTGMLFSERQSPQIQVDGDPDTEDFINCVADVARLWPAMILARQYGGATGSACIGFQFLGGKPVIEVHDPLWTTPKFIDRHALILESIEKRYQYPMEVMDQITGVIKEESYWYRRIIDQEKDVLFAPCPVGKGEEPNWDEVERKEVVHGFGFCPVVWIQNLPVQDDIDGRSDCDGIYDTVKAIDALLAQANKTLLHNCSATLVISDKSDLSEVHKGNEECIKLTETGSASFLEMSASAPKSAVEFIEVMRRYALESAQCVLEHTGDALKTATEILRAYSSMMSKSDMLREQYGENGVKKLLGMMFDVVQKMTQAQPNPQATEPGQPGMLRGTLTLPPRHVKNPDGTYQHVDRKPGTGGTIRLKWPPYFEPTLQDSLQAAQAAAGATAGGLIDQESGAKFVAPYFKVEDVQAMLLKVQQETTKKQAELESMALGGYVHNTADAGFGGVG